jgi:hypothetical protein
MNIQHFLDNYVKVIETLRNHGFIEPILFKGFSNREGHNFNIVVKDSYTSKTEKKPQTHRLLGIHDDLTRLLHCKVVISTIEDMRENYLKELGNNNSVKLTNNIPTEELEYVFGKNWIFNPPVGVTTSPENMRQTLFAKPSAEAEHLAQKTSNKNTEEEKIQKLLKHLQLDPEVFKDITEHPERLEQLKARVANIYSTPQIPVK